MSMITFTDPGNIPVLVADSLISGPDNESALTLPDHPHGISSVFPPQSGFVPTCLARKTSLINLNLAIAMVGSVIHMRAFRQDVQEHFRRHHNCSANDVELFLQQYKRDSHGKNVLDNIAALILNSHRVDHKRHIYRLLTSATEMPDLLELDSKTLGHILATGCGAEGLKAAINAIDSYSFSGSGSINEWSVSHEAIARNLSLIARLHKIDELTGQMLLNYWGGGYEVIYRQIGGGLTYLNEYTLLFWTLDLDDRKAEYRPEGFIKYERRDDFSILISYRQGMFNFKGMVDVDVGLPRRPILIENPDREYLNSHIHMNVVCTFSGNRMTGMYHFCHRYKRGESNLSMVFIRDDNRAEVAISSDWARDTSQFIRDSEERKRYTCKNA